MCLRPAIPTFISQFLFGTLLISQAWQAGSTSARLLFEGGRFPQPSQTVPGVALALETNALVSLTTYAFC